MFVLFITKHLDRAGDKFIYLAYLTAFRTLSATRLCAWLAITRSLRS